MIAVATAWLIRSSDAPLTEAKVPTPVMSRIPANGAIRILFLGSSLSAQSDWPLSLRDGLRDALRDCSATDVEIDIVAKGGADSSWGLAQLSKEPALHHDLIFIEFMINDADFRNLISRDQSLRNHEGMIGIIKDANPDSAVFLLRLNRAYGPRALLRPFLARYERLLPKIAQRSSIGLIDARPEWGELWRREGYSALPDGLHPTVSAATEVNVGKILPAAIGVLQPVCEG